MTIRVVLDEGDLLGEGPVWDVGRRCLWWVDIDARRVHRYVPATGAHDAWETPGRPSALAVRARHDSLLVASEHGVGFFDPATGAWRDWLRLEDPAARPHNRTNDGKCDPDGSFWVGTMHADVAGRTGALYRVRPDGTVDCEQTGLGIPNTFAWADGRMYFGDSLDRAVRTWPGGTTLFELPEGDACPDGSTIDADGNLWTCIWDGARIEHRDGRSGALLGTVEVPVQRPTSCAFGGPDLTTLYVTSAGRGLASPDGALLAIDGCGRGLPEPRFEG